MFLSPTELTINVLPMLSQSCPQLEHLSLFVNTDVDDQESVPLQALDGLKSINFGVSPVQDKHFIAKLLARVLPANCEVISSPLYQPEVEALLETGPEEQYAREARRNEWAQISEWIPVLLEFRREASAISQTALAGEQAVGQV
ncbi:hypothetical protein SCHPADRAFT_927959 [Schizopora paradoxa]|uniref:F-box domain-containing protein n=1 Tax=Schizopora paradoxa TaxID=27342 RepID=A0A0H2SBF0_9AGAM|nr:hypothetical protein SCHPADRAFT_927959 [Schizopora paradoxa]